MQFHKLKRKPVPTLCPTLQKAKKNTKEIFPTPRDKGK